LIPPARTRDASGGRQFGSSAAALPVYSTAALV
jgi:hypothetical protein